MARGKRVKKQEPEDEDDEDKEPFSIGPILEQIEDKTYKPDPIVVERWSRLFASPNVACTDNDQLARVITIRKQCMILAAHMLKFCPNSHDLDKALAAIHEAQMWSICAIQSNE